MARRSARAALALVAQGLTMRDILTDASLRNAMAVHAAFGGSTNLILHLPAVAWAAGLHAPHGGRLEPRQPADAAAGGFAAQRAGAIPRCRYSSPAAFRRSCCTCDARGCSIPDVLTASGEKLGAVLDWWEQSERRHALRKLLRERDGVDPDDVIMDPDRRARDGTDFHRDFPEGELAPGGSVIKSTAIDPSVVDADGVYRKVGPARVFLTEKAAIAAIKSQGPERDQARRRAGADLPRADGIRHGGDFPTSRWRCATWISASTWR